MILCSAAVITEAPSSLRLSEGTLSNRPLSEAHTETADFKMARMGPQAGVDSLLRDGKRFAARWSRIW